MRKLKKLYPDKLSILSVMVDKDLADTIEAVESGKITWDVAWDGDRGPIATRWAISRFPTVYVIGRDGIVTGVDLRGDELTDRIVDLTN